MPYLASSSQLPKITAIAETTNGCMWNGMKTVITNSENAVISCTIWITISFVAVKFRFCLRSCRRDGVLACNPFPSVKESTFCDVGDAFGCCFLQIKVLWDFSGVSERWKSLATCWHRIDVERFQHTTYCKTLNSLKFDYMINWLWGCLLPRIK